jgi:hypothetical protein
MVVGMSLQSVTSRHTVTLHARTSVTGAAGGKEDTYATAGVTARCTVEPASVQDKVTHLQNGASVSHVLMFSESPSVANGDKILFGSRVLFAVGNPENVQEQNRLWYVFAEESEARQ